MVRGGPEVRFHEGSTTFCEGYGVVRTLKKKEYRMLLGISPELVSAVGFGRNLNIVFGVSENFIKWRYTCFLPEVSSGVPGGGGPQQRGAQPHQGAAAWRKGRAPIFICHQPHFSGAFGTKGSTQNGSLFSFLRGHWATGTIT